MGVVVYLDDIAVFGDTEEQVLEDTLEAVRRLTAAGFMINLTKSQLVESTAKVLGHKWTSGGFWEPVTTKIEALQQLSGDQLGRMSRSSLYGLLNFFREYVPTFAELTEPLRQLLGQDAKPWTPEAEAAVREVLQRITSTPRWLNSDPAEELRMEARVRPTGIAVVLLQRNPERKLKWLPVASWGRCLDALERLESHVLLELKALREGAWKLSEFTAFSRNLVMRISPELKALLKVSNKAHPELQALLIDLLQYKPKLLVGASPVSPAELGMEAEAPEAEPPPPPDTLLKDMVAAEKALTTQLHMPPKARFVKGKSVHV